MVLTYIPVSLVPAAVSIAVTAVIVYTIVICVCRKRSTKNEPELTDIKVQQNSSLQSPDSLRHKGIAEHNNVTDPGGVHIEPDTAITPVDQRPKQNGTLHSRGNSADLTKPDRYSGTSSGSSPRQATLSRELPDIPVQMRDKGSHSHLPEVPSGARQSNLKHDNIARGTHAHAQLPDIPKSHASPERVLRGVNIQDTPVIQQNKSPTIPRSSAESKTSVVRLSQEVPIPQSSSKSELDDYDHITEPKIRKMRPRSDYDHVLIEGDEKRIIPARHIDDPDYAEVKNENIYEGVPDDVTVVPVKVKSPVNVTQTKTKTSIIVGKAPVKETCVDDPPYNRIKDDSPGLKDLPYNKIKEDPSYNDIKDVDPYNKVKDDDPYNKVKGEEDIDDIDPYNTVIDTDSVRPKRKFPFIKTKVDGPNYDPYALVDDERDVSNQSNFTDPYARVCDTDIDDPYNKVIDDDDSSSKSVKKTNTAGADQEYAVVNKVGRVEYATVNKLSIRRKNDDRNNIEIRNEGKQKNQTRYASDEYSTVMKFRQENHTNDTNTEVAGTSHSDRTSTPRSSQPPEEPPRDYGDDEDEDDNVNTDADHYNTVLQVGNDHRATASVTTAATTTTLTTATITTATTTTLITGAAGTDTRNTGPGARKEPPYTKLSARESLASMNARLASNTYEIVSEVDNLYATVEGGSGDGVVRQEVDRQPTHGHSAELYAEITDSVSAPAPPSLDSLHETAKQQSNQRTPGQGHCRTPSGQGHSRTPSGQGHFRTPSGDINTGNVEGRATLATEEVVDLDPLNYRKDAATPDELEYDPNYETVEEARSRAKYEEINGNSKMEKKIRAHVYEEVTVTNEARRSRQRVLNLHTYEDITEVKDVAQNKHRNSKSKSDDTEKSKTVSEKTSCESGTTGVEGKSKKSKADNEKTKDKVKEKKKSESKDKSDKPGKSGKK